MNNNNIIIDEAAEVELYEEINPIENSTIAIGREAIVKVAPTAKIINSHITVPPKARLTIGDGCLIEDSKILMRESSIVEMGNFCAFVESTARILEDNAVFTVGDCCRINRRCSFFISESIALMEYCLLSADCLLTDSQIHSLDWQERRAEIDSWISGKGIYTPELRSAPLKIGSDCWLGRAAQILITKASSGDKTLSIGSKSVIGAGAVVKESVPAKSIAVGVPAKVVRFL